MPALLQRKGGRLSDSGACDRNVKLIAVNRAKKWTKGEKSKGEVKWPVLSQLADFLWSAPAPGRFRKVSRWLLTEGVQVRVLAEEPPLANSFKSSLNLPAR